MGHHLNKDGFFQSDKNPELAANKIALDFRDIYARPCLELYAARTKYHELSDDIFRALTNTEHLIKEPD